MAAWLLLTLLARPAAAQASTSTAAVGWVKQASSLLLYDSSGTLVSEVGLAHSEEAAQTTFNVADALGGAAKSGRFAWTLEKKTSWNLARTKLLESKTSFRFLGSDGTELWKSSKVDVPESGEPVSLSDDGEMLAVARHSPSGWTAALKSYVGNTLQEVGPFPGLKYVEITPNGKYMHLSWVEPEKSSTDTFIEAATKKRKDIPSDLFARGFGKIDSDGKVFSGKKLLFDFALDKP